MNQVMNSDGLASNILSPKFDGKRFAIGKNPETLQVHAVAPLAGIVDDSSGSSDRWQGIHLIGATELPPGCGVINCATSVAPVSAERRVRAAGVAVSLISFDCLQRAQPNSLRPPSFVCEMNADWEKNKEEWRKLRDTLADEESKTVFDDIVQFRRTGSYAHMSAYRVRLHDQYFDDVCPLRSGEVFVDCGGFDGDTTEQLARRCPQYNRVWLFEPSEVNMQKAKKRLAGARDIHFVPKGVSDQIGRLSFNSGAGSASAVSDSGDASIDVTTIDKEIEETVSFIKMDLEGWELKALAGARHHIERDHPRLAIAVYHHASDFWMIPEFILSIRSDYDVFLRHYTEGWSETVMYFVQKSGNK